MSILLKSKAFYLFDSHSRNCFRRVSSQEFSFLLNFSSIKSVVSYIFDMDREFLRTKPYEIQHVVILHLANEVRLRKKLYKIWSVLIGWKFVNHKIKNKDRIIVVKLASFKVSFTKEMLYHFQLLLTGSVHVLICFQSYILFSVVHYIFKYIRLLDSLLYFYSGAQICKNLQIH